MSERLDPEEERKMRAAYSQHHLYKHDGTILLREIDALRTERDTAIRDRDRLRDTLRPFADYANMFTPSWPDTTGCSCLFKQPDGSLEHNPDLNLGHCRAAAALVAEMDAAAKGETT